MATPTAAIVPDDVFVDLTTDLTTDMSDDALRSPSPCPPPAPRLSPCAAPLELEPAMHFLGAWAGDDGHTGRACALDQGLADAARVLRLARPSVVERGVDGVGLLSVPAMQALLGDGEAMTDGLTDGMGSTGTLPDLAGDTHAVAARPTTSNDDLGSDLGSDPFDAWERECVAASMPPLTMDEMEAAHAKKPVKPSPAHSESSEPEGSPALTESEDDGDSESDADDDSDFSCSDESDSDTESEEPGDDDSDDMANDRKTTGTTETSDCEGARVYAAVERVFEPVEGGAITGHLTRTSIDRLFRVLAGMPPAYAMGRESLFLDLGSGMGYLVMYALLFCDRSLGVEFAPLIHAQSAQVLRNVLPTLDFCKRAAVVRGDIFAMESLCRPVPATHVHTFAFSIDVLHHIVDLLVRGNTRPRCVSIIPRSEHELVDVGLLPPDGPTRDARREEHVLHSFFVTMPSGDRHKCWVFAVTDDLLEACEARAKVRPVDAESPSASVSPSVMKGMMHRARARLYHDDDLEYRDTVDAVDPVALCSSRPTKRRRKNIGSASASL